MAPLKSIMVAGLLVGAGVLLASVAVTFGVVPLVLGVAPIDARIAGGLAIGGVALAVLGFLRLPASNAQLALLANDKPEPERSKDLYGQYLVGVGFALLVVGLMCSALFAALAWCSGRPLMPPEPGAAANPLVGDTWDGRALDGVGGDFTLLERLGLLFGASPGEAHFVVVLFVLSTMVAMLGALFFFANALWAKIEQPERDPFDAQVFWAGLWFRIGEAVLFNIVFFLCLRSYAPDRYLYLPLVSLLVGMFLKSGEALVKGIAERVLDAFKALVPTTLAAVAVTRVWAFGVGGLPINAADREAKLTVLVEGIEALKGVTRVDADLERAVVRVDFDPQVSSRARIRREAEFRGLTVLDSPPV